MAILAASAMPNHHQSCGGFSGRFDPITAHIALANPDRGMARTSQMRAAAVLIFTIKWVSRLGVFYFVVHMITMFLGGDF
jgi:hypothetical protein